MDNIVKRENRCLQLQKIASLPHFTIIVIGMIVISSMLQASPGFQNTKALDAFSEGNLEKAESELQLGRFEDPNNSVISYNLGVISYRKRDYQNAAIYFARAASLADSSKIRFDSFYNLGNSTFKAGDYTSAINAYATCLEVKKNFQAEYNLNVAKEKLKQQLKEQQQQKDNQQQQQDEQQKNDQKSGEEKDENGQQQNQQQGDGQKRNDQKSGDEKDKSEQENSEQQSAQNKKDKEKTEGSEGQQGDEQEQEQEQEQQTAQSEKQQQDNASQTQELTKQSQEDPSEDRREVEMAQEADNTVKEPEASQRARALKNMKLNDYQVQRLLKQMEEREQEAQIHYRNDIRAEEDPYQMNEEQLKEFFRHRRRPYKQETDEPDW